MNGYTNPETYRLALNLSKIYSLYQHHRNRTSEYIAYWFADEVDKLSNGEPDDNDILPVLLNVGSLDRVNWDEIQQLMADEED